MRQLLLPVALAAIVALLAVAVIAVVSAPAPTRPEEAAQLAAQLRCPDCAGLSVADSTTQSAAAIRTEIVEQLDAGATPEQVRAHFVDRYGEWILLSPSSPVAWLLPVAIVLAGAGLLAAWLLRRPASGLPAATAQPDAAALARVREEAEALDA